MSEYHVYFTTVASAPRITVEAEDCDEAIEAAWEQLPSNLCHQCARQVDISGDWVPEEVADADGNTVWKEKRQ